MSSSSWPHGPQHARLPCPSPAPGACSNSCPLSRWCLSTISSSVIPLSSCLQSFPASGSFLRTQIPIKKKTGFISIYKKSFFSSCSFHLQASSHLHIWGWGSWRFREPSVHWDWKWLFFIHPGRKPLLWGPVHTGKCLSEFSHQQEETRDFPGGPMAVTPSSQ